LTDDPEKDPRGIVPSVGASKSAPYTLYIWGQGVGAIIKDATADQRVDSKRPQSNLVDTAVGYTVQTFEAPELGVVFSYLTAIRK
jgi:hypothetical protein